MDGMALDLFGPGRYTLETQNIPKIGKILDKTIDKKHPSIARFTLLTKQYKWQSNGVRIQR